MPFKTAIFGDLILLTMMWKLSQSSLAPGTFTSFEIGSTSGLTVQESVFRWNVPSCLNWCTSTFDIRCKVVLFDSDNKLCQRAIGEVRLADGQKGTKKWVYVLHRKGNTKERDDPIRSQHLIFLNTEAINAMHFKFSHKHEYVIVRDTFELPHVINFEICPKHSNGCCEVRDVTNINHDTNKIIKGTDLQVSYFCN